LWHGANWTFIIWGALHGFYLIFGILTKNSRDKISSIVGLNKLPRVKIIIQTIITFSLATFAWIFFRAKSVHIAFYIIKTLVTGLFSDIFKVLKGLSFDLNLGVDNGPLLISISALILMEIIHLYQTKYNLREWLQSKTFVFRWAIYLLLILTIMNFGEINDIPFIYFQF
jgi:alginate O-acetyltransferase complex protein AlgI